MRQVTESSSIGKCWHHPCTRFTKVVMRLIPIALLVIGVLGLVGTLHLDINTAITMVAVGAAITISIIMLSCFRRLCCPCC
ncbi:MAG: hypothetical protein KR126chlam2_01227 [Chlamydiae bacterium]|nr:hypothetical protein [Chlamydiota bacterium]